MKAELERMEQKVEEVSARKGDIIARAKQAKAGGGTEALGARPGKPGAFAEFRRMEDQIEGVEASIQAQREVDEALGGGRGPGGLSRDEVEAKFRALEAGVSPSSEAASSDIDEELSQLKTKVRIKT
jgi:phage shock protein A